MIKEPKGVFHEEGKEPVIERVFQLIDRYPSRSAAARAWGINVNTLKNYYRRQDIQPTPRKSQLSKIADVEGVSLEWLMTGSGDAPKSQERADRSQEGATKSQGGDQLINVLSFLTERERQQLTELLVRKGVETVLYLLDENNIKLLQLPDDEKERLMALHEAKKGAFEDNQDNELSRPTHKAG